MKHKLSTRVAAALTIGALAFTVAACGSDDEPSRRAAAVAGRPLLKRPTPRSA